MTYDFRGLNDRLLPNIGQILIEYLPGGHIEGHEYVCGSLSGGKGRSCKVNLKTGVWADFASNEKGGDLISLYAAIKQITQGEAFVTLSKEYNFISTPESVVSVPRETALKDATSQTSELAFKTSPANAPIPEMYHPKHGKPSSSWCYLDRKGDRMFYMARYDTEDGKEFIPWSFVTGDKWVCKAWPAPRPVYGLNELENNPNKPVLIVEGEKACEAARKLVSVYCVITWPGGSNAYNKIDWSPVYGRKVLIWPDRDKAGISAANGIANILVSMCPEIKIINHDPELLGDGWDCADALNQGWTKDDFYQWAKPNVQIFAKEAVVVNNTQINNTQINNVQQTVEEVIEPPSESNIAMWDRLGLALTKQGHAIINEDNVIRIFKGELTLGNSIWFDDFHKTVFISDSNNNIREMRDLDIIKLTVHIQSHYGMSKMTDSIVRRALAVVADRVHKHEPRDWMDTLVWDGVPRIDKFFVTHLGAQESEYVLTASKNFWVSMAARIYRPGCIMRTMIILKSQQWAGKSTAFSLIGGKWYAEALESIQSNNFLQSLHGKMIVEFADMSGMDRADVNRIKQVISCRMDRFRAPYDRQPADHERQCVLVSTTNEGQFLRDDTGGSRFWPIETGTIRHDEIIRDRDQLFAEAVHRFKGGENWHIMPEAETLSVQEYYRQQDEWEIIIQDYLDSKYHLFSDGFTILKIAKEVLQISADKLDKSCQMRIARNLMVLGYSRFQKRLDGKVTKLWRKIKND